MRLAGKGTRQMLASKGGRTMRVAIIGGNGAGMSAASRLVRKGQGLEVAVFEKTREVSYGACGLPYYISDLNPDIDLMRIRSKERFEQEGIKVHLEQDVIGVDTEAHFVLVCDRTSGICRDEPYDRLIVASGASPIIPSIPGTGLAGVFSLRSLSDGEAIKKALQQPDVKNVSIIGGGYIGLELSEACVIQKKQVRLFEAKSNLLYGFDPEFGQAAEQELIRHGVEVHTGEQVKALSGEERVDRVLCAGDAYETDLVIIAIGVHPNTSFIDSPLMHKDTNGALITDAKMQTSVRNIYAAGDCTTVIHKILKRPVYIPLGTNANKQGRIVADVIMGQPSRFDNALGTAMLRCLDMEFARTGITEQDARAAGLSVGTVTVETLSHARYFPDPVWITIKLCYDPVSRILLGAQLMGRKECAWRVDVLACAVDRGMTAEELGFLDLGYAPPFSTTWDVVQIAANAIK